MKFADFRAGASCSVEVSLVFSDDELTLVYDVVDDKVHAPSKSTADEDWYADDNAEFFIAGASSSEHFHVIVSASGLATFMDEKNKILTETSGFSATSKLQSNGYNVEIEITWGTLGIFLNFFNFFLNCK